MENHITQKKKLIEKIVCQGPLSTVVVPADLWRPTGQPVPSGPSPSTGPHLSVNLRPNPLEPAFIRSVTLLLHISNNLAYCVCVYGCILIHIYVKYTHIFTVCVSVCALFCHSPFDLISSIIILSLTCSQASIKQGG